MTRDEVAAQLERWVDRLAEVAGRRPAQVPEFGTYGDFGALFINLHDDGSFSLEAWERGKPVFQRYTADLDELMYWIVDYLAHQLAFDKARMRPEYSEVPDPRRLWFPEWQRYVAAVNPVWAERTERYIADVLARSPYRG